MSTEIITTIIGSITAIIVALIGRQKEKTKTPPPEGVTAASPRPSLVFLSILSAGISVTALIVILLLSSRALRTEHALKILTTESSPFVQQTEWPGISIELVSLKRSEGDTVMLEFAYVNNGTRELNLSEIVRGLSAVPLADSIYLVDYANQKRYKPLTIDYTMVASETRHFRVDPGKTKRGWVKFQAPPPAVDRITVLLPGAKPFEAVPIQRQ